MVRETKPKLLLLDVLMPGRDGWSILRECKSDPELKDMPVIMVSQLNQDTLANSLGADDYITKPFSPKVLLARIKAVLRRTKSILKGNKKGSLKVYLKGIFVVYLILWSP